MAIETTGARRSSREIAASLRSRFRFLLVTGMLVVGIAFGMSFYFSLVSGQTAVASQIPELAGVVDRLRNTLVLNTVGFGVVLIVSLAMLARLVTARLFRPLESVERGLERIARGELPLEATGRETGPFAATLERYEAAASALRNREREEHETLAAFAAAHPEALDDRMVALIERKRSSLAGDNASASDARDANDPLFMQPV